MSQIDARPGPGSGGRAATYAERALLLWPRLDHARLRRTHDDPRKIARLVARRTTLSVDEILALLTQRPGR